jgi:hypothetical protein
VRLRPFLCLRRTATRFRLSLPEDGEPHLTQNGVPVSSAARVNEPNLLSIYLNDHLAGATAGADLSRRLAHTHRASPDGAVVIRLAEEIVEDRATLIRLMKTLDIRPNQLKVAAGWLAEKAGRLKLNGHLLTRSPLSTVIEMESMRLGVEGKAAGWRTLRALAERNDRLNPEEIDRLVDRANRQIKALENLRVDAVARVFVDRQEPREQP